MLNYGFSYSLKLEFEYSVPDLTSTSKTTLQKEKVFQQKRSLGEYSFIVFFFCQLTHLEGNAERIKDF